MEKRKCLKCDSEFLAKHHRQVFCPPCYKDFRKYLGGNPPKELQDFKGTFREDTDGRAVRRFVSPMTELRDPDDEQVSMDAQQFSLISHEVTDFEDLSE